MKKEGLKSLDVILLKIYNYLLEHITFLPITSCSLFVYNDFRSSNLIIGNVNNVNDMENEMIKMYSEEKIKNNMPMPILLVCPIQNIIFDTQHFAFYSLDSLTNKLFIKVAPNHTFTLTDSQLNFNVC